MFLATQYWTPSLHYLFTNFKSYIARRVTSAIKIWDIVAFSGKTLLLENTCLKQILLEIWQQKKYKSKSSMN
jgi:hypothetical protein